MTAFSLIKLISILFWVLFKRPLNYLVVYDNKKGDLAKASRLAKHEINDTIGSETLLDFK